VFLSFFILLLAAFQQERRKSLSPVTHLVLNGVIFLGLVLVVFSYSRMTLAGLGIGFVTLAWFRRDWRIPVALVIVATTLVILFLFDDTDYSRFEDRGEVRWVQKVKSSVTAERLRTSREVGRLGVTLYALNIVQERPLFGVGPGNWGNPLALTYDEHTRYVLWRDNIPFEYFYLQDNNWGSTLGQIGIPGTLAFLAILVSLFFRSVRGYQSHQDPWLRFLCLGFTVVTASYVIEGLFQPNFVIRMIAFTYWILAGLVMASLRAAPVPARKVEA
jgi:O-antigen ligase